MKKLFCFIFSIMIMLSACIPAYASSGVEISLDTNSISSSSPTQYGINLDGMPSSNLVANGSFEDSTKAWQFPNDEGTYSTNNPISKNNKTFCVIDVDKSYILKNTCYDGASFVKDNKYEFSFYARNVSFEGTISVWLDSDKNRSEATQLSTAGISKNSWTRFSAELTATETEVGSLAIEFDGSGTIEIDFVALEETTSYGFKEDTWKGFGLQDKVWTALQNINPAFLSFSLSEPIWKNTIGPAAERKNSELGCHEYLQLCKDLDSVAIPVINTKKYKANTSKFTNYKQDILDLIEYANSSSDTSYYGSLRASNGSVEPFNLKYIQLIGDGERYNEIKNAITSKYSDITVLGNNDITVIENSNRDIAGTLENIRSTLASGEFVMYGNCFDDLIKISADKISYSTTYLAQMLIANNQGSKLIDVNVRAENVDIQNEITFDSSKNSFFISLVNSGSSFEAIIDTAKLDDVTSASIQYVNDGYLSSYNDLDKQYVAPNEKNLEFNSEENYIKAKIPENSVCVIRITFNGANADSLFSLPDAMSYKTKNYVPPVLIAVIVSLALAIPLGSIIGFVLYRKVISKKAKERSNE